MDALDELLQLDLVRPTDVPRRFRFRHPLVRRAVYETTAGGWRLGAHERCADALAARGATRRGARAPRRAVCARGRRRRRRGAARGRRGSGPARAGERGALVRRRAAPAAADRAGRRADRAARSRARARWPRPAISPRATRRCSRRSRLVPGDPRAARQGRARCAAVESLLGRHGGGRRAARGRLGDLPDQGSAEAVALMIELAVNSSGARGTTEMRDWAERAVSAARRLGDAAADRGRARPARARGGDDGRGRASRSERVARRRRSSTRCPTTSSPRHLDAAAWLAGAELYLDRYAEGDAHADPCARARRATGQGEHLLVLVADPRRPSGACAASWPRPPSCWTVGSRRRACSATRMRSSGASPAARALRCRWATSSSRSRPPGGRRSLPGRRRGFHSAEAAVELARALLETGQPGPALELLLDPAGGEELTLIAGSRRARCLELLTRCRLALDRPAEAERAAAPRQAWASAVQLPIMASVPRHRAEARRITRRWRCRCASPSPWAAPAGPCGRA